jgi:hypothetical protein
MVLSAIAEIVNEELRTLNFTSKNTLFAASLCPDEINHHENSLTSKLHWSECFQMGGLAGIPFPGERSNNFALPIDLIN